MNKEDSLPQPLRRRGVRKRMKWTKFVLETLNLELGNPQLETLNSKL